MSVINFQDLKIWKEAYSLTLEIYSFTKMFPHDERFGLCSQLRRSSISVGANITEGHTRGSVKDYIRFLIISRASVSETIHHCLIARGLGYLNEGGADYLVGRYRGLSAGIYACIKSLQKNNERKTAV